MAPVLPATLGALRASEFTPARVGRSVKDELRENLIARLRAMAAANGEATLFPGIVGYEDTVVPQLVNAVLSRHNFILLGLRGQAKSRILRALTQLLDPIAPYIAGSEIRENPTRPLPQHAHALISNELPMHYGLLPRANRGIFAVNELPDLAGKIQVALFNIMQEGDVQIKGYPVRLELDVMLTFSANPEDYTARGKIVTPLKDRIGSEIRTHYPETIEEGIAITAQEAWSE